MSARRPQPTLPGPRELFCAEVFSEHPWALRHRRPVRPARVSGITPERQCAPPRSALSFAGAAHLATIPASLGVLKCLCVFHFASLAPRPIPWHLLSASGPAELMSLSASQAFFYPALARVHISSPFSGFKQLRLESEFLFIVPPSNKLFCR